MRNHLDFRFCSVAVMMILLSGSLLYAGPSEVDDLVENNNRFALELYKELASSTPGRNRIFSPYSIAESLIMTYAGSRGSTEKEWASVMKYPMPSEELCCAFRKLRRGLPFSSDDISLITANSIWVQPGAEIRAEYTKWMDSYFDADLYFANFRGRAADTADAVNNWVERKTQGYITGMVSPEMFHEEIRLLLINALYFDGKWKFCFDQFSTVPDLFYVSPDKTVPIQLMSQDGVFNYACLGGDGLELVELPYRGGDLSMLILLPRSGQTLEQVEEKLTCEKLNEWMLHLMPTEITLQIPRFTAEDRLNLKELLRAMGLCEAFDSGKADFSGMLEAGVDGYYIGNLIHSAKIEVDEKGTRAAACTMTEMDGFAARPPCFRADRPFMYLIRDLASGSILFMGRLTQP